MSKFKHVAEGIDAKARELFAGYEKARKAAEDARERFQSACNAVGEAKRTGVGEGAASAARLRAQGDLEEARAAWNEARFGLQGACERIVAEARDELEQAAFCAADPGEVDQAGLALLDSGIIRAADYEAMLDKYEGNATMTRLVSKRLRGYADGAEQEERAAALSVLGAHDAEGAARQGLDAYADFLMRAARNDDMMKAWDAVTPAYAELF